ncbi:MAG TPA: NAD(P)-dependent oxidoreductase [Burkholderiaceae bacterium]|nr:NAD(P)-dependent oxidoreductase [Burkholderiaceae bacterium]
MKEPGDKYQVTIIGVGNMGGGMARNLLAKGWPVNVCDIETQKVQNLVPFGAVAIANPAQAAINSVVTIICVVDAVQTQDVLFGDHGVAAAMQLGRVVMLCPTLAPDDVERFARDLNPYGLHAIDAPMSGGPVRAADGSMSLMVACAPMVFERYRALIEALSNKVFRISERLGDGARTKLVNNLLAGINLVGAAEVMVMAQKMGLDVGQTLDVIEQSSGQSWIGSDRMRRAIAGDFAPRAHMTLLEKDTRLAVQAAQSAGFAGPLGAAARDVFAQASAGGLNELDDAALFTWLNRQA